MDIEQCVEMMTSLRDTYTKFALSGNIKEDDVYKLKNVLIEIELSMVSIRKSVSILETKLQLLKN